MPEEGNTTTVVGDVEKIAVLRANALGDYILTLPALTAIRETYGEAELVLLASDWHQRFLEGRPGPIDRVVVVPPSQGVRELDGVEPDEAVLDAFFREMQREAFDLAFQLHGGGRYSNPFVRRLGARVTVGLRADDAEPLDRWTPYVYYQHEILRFVEVVALAGARAGDLQPRLAVTDRDRAEAGDALSGADVIAPLAALHPGAADPRRRWPVERFAAVGDELAAAGARVVVTGSREDAPLVHGVVDAMSADALPLAGRLTLGGLAGLLARCSVVVSNDTGPRHLAEAVDAPTVGIYWCGNLVNAGPVTRARHRPAISWRIHCPVCGVDCTRDTWPARTGGTTCRHRASFVADVEVAEVAAPALELLERGREPSAAGRRRVRRSLGLARAGAPSGEEGGRVQP
ncbi:MAG: glycosyltransferase family 9 protein, partial [Thermoleophilia bacterium]|nr:glycosyltransferase family 9 protein [Thermoleophilia bacterium]